MGNISDAMSLLASISGKQAKGANLDQWLEVSPSGVVTLVTRNDDNKSQEYYVENARTPGGTSYRHYRDGTVKEHGKFISIDDRPDWKKIRFSFLQDNGDELHLELTFAEEQGEEAAGSKYSIKSAVYTKNGTLVNLANI